jgi:hypothetical protein
MSSKRLVISFKEGERERERGGTIGMLFSQHIGKLYIE